MTKPKTKLPIESFGPQLMEALRRGGREQVVIPFIGDDGQGKRLAHAFQHRIHTLRSRMREENHPDFIVAARAKCSLLIGERAADMGPEYAGWRHDDQGQRGALIVIRPQDIDFEDALSKMKVTAIEAEPPTTAPIEPANITLDELLEDLK